MTTIKNYTQKKKKKNYSQNNNNVGCVVLLLKKKNEKRVVYIAAGRNQLNFGMVQCACMYYCICIWLRLHQPN